MSLSPVLSSVSTAPNAAWSNSWISISNDQNRPLFAQATYPVNNLGSNGITVITGTNAVYGNFSSIQIIASTQFTALTASGTNSSITNIEVPTFPAAFVLNGNYTGIKLASGSAIAYNL
jgi:hypothetical protein